LIDSWEESALEIFLLPGETDTELLFTVDIVRPGSSSSSSSSSGSRIGSSSEFIFDLENSLDRLPVGDSGGDEILSSGIELLLGVVVVDVGDVEDVGDVGDIVEGIVGEGVAIASCDNSATVRFLPASNFSLVSKGMNDDNGMKL